MPDRPFLHLAPAALLIAASAVARDAGAGAPACRYMITGPVALDPETGLTWQRVAPLQHITRDQAVAYCSGLSLSGAGWRLPTVYELQTILDIGAMNPAMDAATFTDATSQAFWTATSVKGDPSTGVSVDFGYAITKQDDATNLHVVRCVR
jgi:formylglycine-generating enzyme required for sulfatase activity